MGSRDNWCKHYNGFSGNTTCRAGLDYGVFKTTPHSETPCLNREKCEACLKSEYRTKEDIERETNEMNARIARMGVVRLAIVEACGGPWKSGTAGKSGTIECPNCKGQVSFSRASSNGHIHARCNTPGCASWME